MFSIDRREYLKSVMATGVTLSLAGCAEIGIGEPSAEVPAGSLQFENRDSVPHEISLTVLNVGASVGERRDGHDTVTGTPDGPVTRRNLTVTSIVNPGETETYESVFRSPVWYDVRFTMDGEYPGEDLARTVFNPAYPNDENSGQILRATISAAGGLQWEISVTENLESAFD